MTFSALKHFSVEDFNKKLFAADSRLHSPHTHAYRITFSQTRKLCFVRIISRSIPGVGLRPLGCWDREFESC